VFSNMVSDLFSQQTHTHTHTQIITLLHVSTLSCHPQGACNQYIDKSHKYPMYHYNDRLTQLFASYKYIWLWLQCFDPLLGHHQDYIIT
jgi:hypothetical protein